MEGTRLLAWRLTLPKTLIKSFAPSRVVIRASVRGAARDGMGERARTGRARGRGREAATRGTEEERVGHCEEEREMDRVWGTSRSWFWRCFADIRYG